MVEPWVLTVLTDPNVSTVGSTKPMWCVSCVRRTWRMNLIKKTFTSFWINLFLSWYFYESGACQALLFQRQQSARNVLRTNSSCFIEAPQIGRQEIRDNSPFRFTDLCPTQIRTASNKSHESPCKKKVDDHGWSGSIWRIFSLWIFDVKYFFKRNDRSDLVDPGCQWKRSYIPSNAQENICCHLHHGYIVVPFTAGGHAPPDTVLLVACPHGTHQQSQRAPRWIRSLVCWDLKTWPHTGLTEGTIGMEGPSLLNPPVGAL